MGDPLAAIEGLGLSDDAFANFVRSQKKRHQDRRSSRRLRTQSGGSQRQDGGDEVEEDEDAAFHLLGSMYSSGASGEEEETPNNPGMNVEPKKNGGKEEEEEDRALEDTMMSGESDRQNDAEELSVGDPEEGNSFNHMIIMDAGSDESEGSSVDFEDFR